MKAKKVTMALYRQIAIDIAKNIASGKYVQGDRLFGRSVLASHYQVSPETIRKAVFLLKDVGILQTEKGSGIKVVSTEKVADFLKQNEGFDTLATLKEDLDSWAKEQNRQIRDILDKIQFAVNQTQQTHVIGSLNPYEIKITAACKVLGKTANELQFWHLTGATIVAVRHGEELILSPGPYATFCQGDSLFIVGDTASHLASMKLLFE